MSHATSNAVGPAQERILPTTVKERSKRTGENLAAANILITEFTVAERMAWGSLFAHAERAGLIVPIR